MLLQFGETRTKTVASDSGTSFSIHVLIRVRKVDEQWDGLEMRQAVPTSLLSNPVS